MEIKLDEKVIAEAMNANATEAIKAACSSYNVKEQIQEQIAEGFVGTILKQAIESATTEINFDHIGRTIAQEITRQVTRVVVATIQEACLETVFKIKGLSEYNAEEKKEMNRITAEFKK